MDETCSHQGRHYCVRRAMRRRGLPHRHPVTQRLREVGACPRARHRAAAIGGVACGSAPVFALPQPCRGSEARLPLALCSFQDRPSTSPTRRTLACARYPHRTRQLREARQRDICVSSVMNSSPSGSPAPYLPFSNSMVSMDLRSKARPHASPRAHPSRTSESVVTPTQYRSFDLTTGRLVLT